MTPSEQAPAVHDDELHAACQAADEKVRCAELHMQRIAEIVRAWESAGEVYRREDSERAVDDISELVQSYRREVETIGNGLAR